MTQPNSPSNQFYFEPKLLEFLHIHSQPATKIETKKLIHFNEGFYSFEPELNQRPMDYCLNWVVNPINALYYSPPLYQLSYRRCVCLPHNFA